MPVHIFFLFHFLFLFFSFLFFSFLFSLISFFIVIFFSLSSSFFLSGPSLFTISWPAKNPQKHSSIWSRLNWLNLPLGTIGAPSSDRDRPSSRTAAAVVRDRASAALAGGRRAQPRMGDGQPIINKTRQQTHKKSRWEKMIDEAHQEGKAECRSSPCWA